MTVVGFWVADDFSFAVGSAVGGADHHLSLPVAIEVVDDEGCIVGARADVNAQVDTPE